MYQSTQRESEPVGQLERPTVYCCCHWVLTLTCNSSHRHHGWAQVPVAMIVDGDGDDSQVMVEHD